MANRRNAFYFFAIILMILGFVSGRAFFLKVSYVLIFLLVVSLVYSWLAVNWLQIGRQTYVRRIQVGQMFEERFRVFNRGWMPKLWLEVRDYSTLPDHHASHVVPFLRYKHEYRWQVQTLCTRRGQFTLGPMTVNSGDPFGLYQFPRHIASTSTIIVYPQTFPIYDFITPRGMLTGGQAVRRLSYETTPHAAGVREYAPGDSMKRIHWKTSARRGKLFTKEFEMDPLGDVWVFLDLSQQSLFERGGVFGYSGSNMLPPSTEEYSIAVAGSLAQYFIEKSRTVGFLSYTPHRNYFAPDRGDRQLTHVLEALATANSNSPMSLGQMLSLESPHITRGSTVVLVTASTNLNWLAEAHTQSRRGVLMIAVLIDPTSFGMPNFDFEQMRRQVEVAGITTYGVRYRDDITQALSYPLGMNGNN